MLSIRDAARQAGVSRSAIFRAIRSGKISAPRKENGDYAIDPSELFRVFEPPPETRDTDEPCLTRQSEQGSETGETNGETLTTLRLHVATLEAELRAQRELVARLDQDKRDLQTERNKWSAQAERLALTGPRRPWAWPWRR
jgi:hypothetical protein